MELRYTLSELEAPSYILAVMGVLLDHFTTHLGLSMGLSEANLYAAALINAGLWLIVDMVLIAGILSITYLIIHYTKERYRWLMLIFPLVLGFCRFAAAVFNLNIIL
jgi:hypothetical protein